MWKQCLIYKGYDYVHIYISIGAIQPNGLYFAGYGAMRLYWLIMGICAVGAVLMF